VCVCVHVHVDMGFYMYDMQHVEVKCWQ